MNTFVDEVIARLESKGVGTFNSNVFASSKAVIPSGPGPFLVVIDTGGTGPTRVQNQKGAKTRRPTAQITARGELPVLAREMALAAFDALDGIYNETIN